MCRGREQDLACLCGSGASPLFVGLGRAQVCGIAIQYNQCQSFKSVVPPRATR